MMHEDWKEFLELLIKHKVKFIIAGAHAMGAHGYARYTGDIDIWIQPTHENAQAMLMVLDEFGMGGLGLELDDLMDPNIIQLGVEPLRIDLLKEIDGITFEQAFLNVRYVSSEGLSLPVMSRDDLIKNKQASNRPKDLHDIEMLKKIDSKRF